MRQMLFLEVVDRQHGRTHFISLEAIVALTDSTEGTDIATVSCEYLAKEPIDLVFRKIASLLGGGPDKGEVRRWNLEAE
jgi:hypothetical protein